MIKNATNYPSIKGMTLVELLVVVLIMGFVSAAAFGIVVAAMGQGRQLEQKCDSVDSIRNALDKIGREVRMGRNLGDCYGDISIATRNVYGSPTYPGGNDAIYGNGAAPPTPGWPVWADGSNPSTFSMLPPPGDGTTNGNNCLVCQIPDFDANGMPLGISPGYKSPGSTALIDPNTTNTVVETHIFRVVADPNNPGEFVLQEATIYMPGSAGIPNYNPPPALVAGPYTIAKHVIGPLNPATGQIRAFQFVDRANPTNPPVDGIPSGGTPPCANFSGIIVNLEVSSHDVSVQQSDQKPLAVKAEIYLRNNALADSQGLPPGSNVVYY